MDPSDENKWAEVEAAVEAANARGDNDVDPVEEAQVFAELKELAHPPPRLRLPHATGGPCLTCGGELRLSAPEDRLLQNWRLTCSGVDHGVEDGVAAPCGPRVHGPRGLVAWLEAWAGYVEARRMVDVTGIPWHDVRPLDPVPHGPWGSVA